MLVHITLNLNDDEVAAQLNMILEQLRRAGVRGIDTKFVRRYGLVSGDLDDAHLAAVESLPFVAAVEPDGEVSAF